MLDHDLTAQALAFQASAAQRLPDHDPLFVVPALIGRTRPQRLTSHATHNGESFPRLVARLARQALTAQTRGPR